MGDESCIFRFHHACTRLEKASHTRGHPQWDSSHTRPLQAPKIPLAAFEVVLVLQVSCKRLRVTL